MSDNEEDSGVHSQLQDERMDLIADNDGLLAIILHGFILRTVVAVVLVSSSSSSSFYLTHTNIFSNMTIHEQDEQCCTALTAVLFSISQLNALKQH